VIQRTATGPIDELAGTLVDLRSRVSTLEVLAHRHVINLDPEAWQAPVFQNAWADLGGAWQVAEFRFVGDLVEIRGVIAGGTIGLAAFTLPVGYRPPADLVFAASSNGAFGSFTITAAGVVTPTVGSAVSFSVMASFSVT
jgi:hypothetical protein